MTAWAAIMDGKKGIITTNTKIFVGESLMESP